MPLAGDDPPETSVDRAVVSHNIAGLHSSSDVGSELISQLVSGAPVRVLDRVGAMVLVEGEDRYRGWVRTEFLVQPRDDSDSPATTIAALIADLHSSPAPNSQLVTKLTVATRVVLGRHSSARDFAPVLLPSGTTAYTHRANLSSTYQKMPDRHHSDVGQSLKQMSEVDRREVLKRIAAAAAGSALRLIGTPYLWGGTTPFGIDCSGLTQLAFRIAGMQLLRDASLQIDDGRFGPVCVDQSPADAQFEAGDLLFFKGSFNHVGIAVGDGSFVHSAGREVGAAVASCGDPEWGEIYVGARRLLPNADLSIDRA